MSEQQKSERRWYEHPLANVVVGFLLTGVLGTALTQHFLDRREREKLRTQGAIERKEAVRQFSELMATSQLRAELLVEATKSGQPADVVAKRKADFEAAYADWRMQRGGLSLLTRDLMSEEHYFQFEEFVGKRLNDGALVPLRACLMDAYRASKKAGSGIADLDCDLAGLARQATECSDAVIDALYVFASAGVTKSGKADPKAVERTVLRVDEACP